ncbi:MAG: hypothetical protein ACTSQC_04330 [Candidatus Heimdallarchaeaceae archaeon]
MSKKLKVSFYLLCVLLFIPLFSTNALSFDQDTDVNMRAEIIKDSRVQAMLKEDSINPTQVLKLIENLENEKNPPSDPEVSIDTIKRDVIDEVQTFWMVTDFFAVTYSEISATLLAIGANSYIYVTSSIISSVGTTNARTRAEEWRDEFETKIYPNNLLYFGNPDGYLGDIDGDNHVTILLADLDDAAGVAGYFDPNNERSGGNSNTREMVYVDYDYNRYSVLAHEFQHLIHYNYDPDEYMWVDEGCAEYTAYLNGYALTTNLTEFARDYFQHNPEDSLLYWNYDDHENSENVRSDYGGAYMFIFYLAEKYGSEAIRNLVSETFGGPLGVENTLDGLGFSIDFNELYLNWVIALNVDDPSFGGGLYGYENLDIDIDYELISIFPNTKTDRLNRFYGMYVAKLVSPGDFMLLEITPPGSYSLAISVAVHDINGWSISQKILDTDISVLINGTLVDTVYIITSIVTSTTPSIPLADTSQFGLGYTDSLDYTYIPGKPLTITSGTLNYQSSTWDFSLYDIYIEDENSTEVTDASGISVYAMFEKSGSSLTTENLELSYDPSNKWNVNENLQYFFEGDYAISIVASGSSQYGELELSSINIAHILTVEEPTLSIYNDTALYVFVNSSYTQLGGWETFTEVVETYVLLYDVTGTPVGIFDISYSSSSNSWESDLLLMNEYNGEHYIKVSFKYAGRTVRSSESDHFQLEGEVTTPTSSIAYPFLPIVFIVSLSAVIFFKKKYKH